MPTIAHDLSPRLQYGVKVSGSFGKSGERGQAEYLFLFSDSFERVAVLLDIHKASGVGIPLYPLIRLWIMGLTAITDGALPMVIDFRGIGRHVLFFLLMGVD
jgi:hypothetical protein